MQNKEELKELLVNEYLNKFLTFYISKTSSLEDAEDLSQKAACEILEALERVEMITNVNAYFWSVAHNVYKNYLSKKNNYILDDDYCKLHIVDIGMSSYEQEQREQHNDIRKALSILSGLYRKVLVYYYYQELKIKDIAEKLNISTDMVKFYLSNGKKKLKEIFNMKEMYGEKSFNPKDFSIYYSGIDFSRVNIWEVFKRKLPGQIALICSEKPKTVSEIAMETGCSSCYIEEELELLASAGVVVEKVKGKYQTNFHILRKEELVVIDEMFKKMYDTYLLDVAKEFENNLENIKATKIYNYEATTQQYKWIFVDMVADLDHRNLYTEEKDYPRILSCGARGLVFGMEAKASKGTAGQTPTYLDNYTLWARDLWQFSNNTNNQLLLSNLGMAKTVINVYNGIIDDSQEEIYVTLIKNNILAKANGKLISKVAYVNREFKALMQEINNRLYSKLEEDTKAIKEYLEKVVSKNLPDNLQSYVQGFVITWLKFFAGNKIIEELVDKGFLTVEGNPQISYFTDK